MTVYVYRNVTRKQWSVRDVETGRVVNHADELVLFDADFKVSEAGRQRVLKEGRKNVHAGVQGRLARGSRDLKRVMRHGQRVTYNPYYYKTFVNLDAAKPISSAGCVYLQSNGEVRVIGPKG